MKADRMLKGTPIPDPLRQRLDILNQVAGPRGWRPTRLIMQNYWLFDYEEFHFVHGRLMLRGANGSGKSSVLASVIPMLLDGNLRRERLDTFGSRSRSVYEYLVGPKDLQEGSPGYHKERRGYVALEFRHQESKHYVTIGLGLFARRAPSGAETTTPTSWGFVIDKNKRIGIDLCLHTTDGPEPASLTAVQLRTVIDQYGTVTTQGEHYQEAVNRALFGFSSVQEFRFLMQLLVELRSPKLNKDIKPEDVCEMLGNAMPPLDDGLLTRVASIIENIDTVAEELETTREQLTAIEEIDKTQADFLNQKAQQAAVEFRERHEDMEKAGRVVAKAEATLEARRKKLRQQEQGIEEARSNRTEIAGRLSILENHELYKRHGELSRLEEELRGAEAQVAKLGESLRTAEQGLNRRLQNRDNLDLEWKTKRNSLADQAEELRGSADRAAWDEVEGVAEILGDRVLTVRIDGQESLPDLLKVAAIREQAEQRTGRLESIREARQRREARESELRQAEYARDQAKDRFRAQDGACQKAEEKAEEARQAAVASLQEWRNTAQEMTPSEAAVQETASRILLYTDHQINPRSLLAPLQEAYQDVRQRFGQRRSALQGELQSLEQAIKATEQELNLWRARREAAPQRSSGQEEARRLLAERGIPAVPLYAACDIKKGVAPEQAAHLEAMLEQAGLLDAVIVPQVADRQVEVILKAADLEDRWIRPQPITFGYTLDSMLEPASEIVSAADVNAALGSIALGENGTQGTASSLSPHGDWRMGVLHGRVSRQAKTQAIYLGESNRRQERQRQIDRLEEELSHLRPEIDLRANAIKQVESQLATLEMERQQMENLTELADLQTRCLEFFTARQALGVARDEMEQKDRQYQGKLEQVKVARLAEEEALRPIPEARGRTLQGIQDLIRHTDRTGHTAKEIGQSLNYLVSLRRRHDEIAADVADGMERVQSAQEDLQAGERRAQGVRQQVETVRELLQKSGTQIDEMLEEVAELRQRDAELEATIGQYREGIGAARESVKHGEQSVSDAKEKLDSDTQLMSQARSEFMLSLRAYSTLVLFLGRAEAGVTETLAVADDLLKYRRGEQGRLPDLVKTARERAWKAFTAAYDSHKATLNDFSPQLEGDYVWFRSQEGRVLADSLKQELINHQKQQELALSDQESDLYEGFILQEVAKEIRDSINRAEEWSKNVNQLLAGRKLSQNAEMSIDWRPLPPDKLTGLDHGRIVHLLRRDAETLTPDQVEEITNYFRTRVAEVREKERANQLGTRFSEALRSILDYRTWHHVVLFKKIPGQGKLEWNSTRFEAGSGGEKALDMFIPLLAAVHARYAGARADAPKLVGIDEAFNGVDEQNTREMFQYLVELDFGFIMTSEKLWGVSPALPGCATYEMVKQDWVSMPILYIWDGKAKMGAMDPKWAQPEGGRGTNETGQGLPEREADPPTSS